SARDRATARWVGGGTAGAMGFHGKKKKKGTEGRLEGQKKKRAPNVAKNTSDGAYIFFLQLVWLKKYPI
ncbi:hypothetical protein Q6247_27115, partial [Klebsiella pneumoniae]